MSLKINIRNALLIFFLILLTITSVYAGQRTYTETNSKAFYIDFWDTYGYSPSYNLEIIRNSYSVLQQLSTNATNIVNFTTSPSVNYSQVLLYPSGTEDFVIRHQAIDRNVATASGISFSFGKYATSGNTQAVTNSMCKINSQSFSNTTSVLTVSSNLQPFRLFDVNSPSFTFFLTPPDYSNSNVTHFDNIINSYYKMKTQVYVRVFLNGTLVNVSYPNSMISSSTINDVNGNPYINYSYIDGDEDLTFPNLANYLKLLNTYGSYGTYKFEFNINPIDYKCDFDFSNSLSSSEVVGLKTNFTQDVSQPLIPTITSPQNNSNLTGTQIRIDASLYDKNGNNLSSYFFVNGVLKGINLNTTGQVNSSITLTNLQDGEYNISVIVSDFFTNRTSTNITVTLENPPTFRNNSASNSDETL